MPDIVRSLQAEGVARVLVVSDDGKGLDGPAPTGTGLSIVQALVRDELRGAPRSHHRN